MMTATDVHAVLDVLDAAGIRVWVDGGWGIDALLGRQTREFLEAGVFGLSRRAAGLLMAGQKLSAAPTT